MSNLTTSDFVEGLAYALETLAFVCLSPADGAAVAPEAAVHCTISCRGGSAMRLNLIAPPSLGYAVAANMLGTDPADPQASERAMDSLREVMNVSCGTLCARIAATSPVPIELDLPESSPIADTRSAWTAAVSRPDAQVLDADGHSIAVWLEVLP